MRSWCELSIPVGVPIDPMNPPSAKGHTDSIVCHFKILIPDQYYYQFYKKIPLRSEKEKNTNKKEVQMISGVSQYGEYDFTTIAMGAEADMFLVILNKKNQRVAVNYTITFKIITIIENQIYIDTTV